MLVCNVNIKTLKNDPLCFDLYSDRLQGARSFLVKVTEFKITKYVKDYLWHCGSIRLVCMYGVLCRDVSWNGYSFCTLSNLHLQTPNINCF